MRTSDQIEAETKRLLALLKDDRNKGMFLYLTGALAALEWITDTHLSPLSDRFEAAREAVIKHAREQGQ